MPSIRKAVLPLLLAAGVDARPNDVLHYDILHRRGNAASQKVAIPALEAAGMEAFIQVMEPFAPAAPDQVSTHQISIKPVEGQTDTSRVINMMFKDAMMPDEVVKTDAPIKNAGGIVYMTSVTVGGQDFQLVIDTGSADTWLVSDPFQCVTASGAKTSRETCKLAKDYERTPNFKQLPGLKFNTAYADGERLEGIMGTETVSIGGVEVTNQTLGLVTKANWYGDGFSSGLLGMAYPSITRAIAANGAVKTYDPVFFTMHKQGKIPAMFSVALNRETEGPGVLALGGLPGGDIKYATEFTKAPMEKMQVRGASGVSSELTMYVAKVSGFTVNGKSVGGATNMVVDSGTTLSFLPSAVISAIHQAWQPQVKNIVFGGGQVTAPCSSKPPKVGVMIGGKELVIDAADLVIPADKSGKICVLGVQNSSGLGLNLLGGPFMKSVLTVFDVGASEMRFAQRVR